MGRGDVFVIDEDTDLLDLVFQHGGKVNRNGLKGGQKVKPDVSSKKVEENVTTEKKTDSRTSSLFPRKPSDDIIDLDVGGSPKKPSLRFPPKIPSSPRTSTESNKLREDLYLETKTVSAEPHWSPTPQTTSGHRTSKGGRDLQPDRERPGIVGSRDGDLVLGSDGKMYRVQRGQPGKMGPQGPDVSQLW